MSQLINRGRLPFVLALLAAVILSVTVMARRVAARPTEPSLSQSLRWRVQDTTFRGDRIDMVSVNDGWILRLGGLGPYIGDEKAGYLYRWNGKDWAFFGSIPHSQIVLGGDITMLSATDGWVVLGGPLSGSDNLAESAIYRWDGNTWLPYGSITAPNAVSLDSLDMLSASEGWASGAFNFGTIYYRWNGISWELFKQGFSDSAYNDLDMVSSSNGWAVGSEISHWDGTDWIAVTSPITTTLNAVSMISSTDGWAVGGGYEESGAILHWNGATWSEVISPVDERLYAIDMISADDGWIVGEKGTILYWDGEAWTQQDSPSYSYDFRSIDMLTTIKGWLTGYYGVLVYETRPELAISATDGAPGSFFTLAGSDYPANEVATVNVNGHDLGTVTTDENGAFILILSTADADEGNYFVTVSVNPSATTQFVLDAGAPVRPQEGEGVEIAVPASIALTEQLFLPTIVR